MRHDLTSAPAGAGASVVQAGAPTLRYRYGMRLLPIAVVLFALPAAVAAQAFEDEAHRLDRLRTQALNRQAAGIVDRRDKGNDGAQREYRDARADYERRLAAWRRRYDACLAGDYSACDDR